MEVLQKFWSIVGTLGADVFIKMGVMGIAIFAISYFLYGKIPTILKVALLLAVVGIFGKYNEYIEDSGYHLFMLLIFGYYVVCSFGYTKMLSNAKEYASLNGGGGIR